MLLEMGKGLKLTRKRQIISETTTAHRSAVKYVKKSSAEVKHD